MRQSRHFISAYALALALIAGPGRAQEPPPFVDFTFKTLRPPAAGARRITVQIDPSAAPPGPGAQADRQADRQAGPGAYDWFWQRVAPEAGAGGPGNLARALAALRENPSVPAPRLQDLQRIAARHGTDILRFSVGTDVSPALVVAMIAVESGGVVDALSDKGAGGLMQLMPDTARRFGVADPALPADNIRGGVAYMAWLMGEFDRDPILALAGYNAGENAVRAAGGVPAYGETRDYVPKVLAAWQVARALCVSRPELITDGCVFRVGESAGDG